MKNDHHIEQLESKVKALYESEEPGRADWTDWLANYHVWVVANFATELAKRVKAREDLARAAALLHDIADVRMSRSDERHEEESLNIARDLMREAGFSPVDVNLVVDDAIRFHSCHGEERPNSVEGKILATADSMSHLKTDFYVYAAWAFGVRNEMSLEEVKQWTLKKIERDFRVKILFDDVREDVKYDYEMIKELFSR
jgi:putative nucleotidyltransferase with HDIG domain